MAIQFLPSVPQPEISCFHCDQPLTADVFGHTTSPSDGTLIHYAHQACAKAWVVRTEPTCAECGTPVDTYQLFKEKIFSFSNLAITASSLFGTALVKELTENTLERAQICPLPLNPSSARIAHAINLTLNCLIPICFKHVFELHTLSLSEEICIIFLFSMTLTSIINEIIF